jgi:hypothetical protein
MDLVLRAYDYMAVTRAETMPVAHLLAALRGGGLRSAEKRRAGLDAEEDVYARETIVERLEGLIQENRGEASLASLRATPPESAAPIPLHGPVIDAEEAIALREDLVRSLTYGLWREREELVTRVLHSVTGRADTTLLLGGAAAFAEVQSVLDIAEDDVALMARFGASVQSALAGAGEPSDDQAVRRQLAVCGQVLGPIARLLRGAHAAALRVIAYRDEPGGDGLTRFLSQDQAEEEEEAPSARAETGGNGHVR